jgi:HEAT repeat protein
MQTEAEQLLQRLASDDSSAADQILGQSAQWTGKTQRTSNATQWITIALNLPALHAREAAVQAELALDGVAQDDSGLRAMEQAMGNPSQRAWALWMLGALGNRGVNPVHVAKIIGSYLSDPQVDVRASAVNGLALVGTDETIPMMLDRFRNDPSPVVQERAACALAESGMYTHEQRMTAAASLVAWLDDSLLTGQQRAWTMQALHDISGQNFGPDSAAWRTWYEGAR